ncbi:MAG: MFS transporter [Gammaproteobacteria bacterium]|nr:MFS transporter [Gammaproteobacteria bacterium]MXY90827.1 MFS transporter [Gammaproteobacteria bacterium]MXZ31881.1 MFS transporter [Gammaproteobacteria bacterium]MYA36763.1 MFS transporter [Gammaproteobacteria bacterium]MYF01115.1 MFS transporter [Gammaproteobacteria bacterium]
MFRGYLRWIVVSLVAIATVINYIDRNALAIMWPAISEDLGMDLNDYALIVSFFMVGYAVGHSLFGKIFDMIGTRLGFVLAIVVWSISIMLHAATRSVLSLGLVRSMLGVSEAGNWPGATKSNAEWFPIKERALAQGIFNSGASVGAIVSAPVIALLYLQFGWQGTFIAVGLLGFLWLVPWLFVYKAPPERHPWLSDEEREYILSGQKTEKLSEEDSEQAAPGWGEMLRYRQSWAVISSRFFLDPVWWLFVSWLPIYLADRFGFDIAQIGLFAWVPYVGAALGAIFGGWLAGKLIKTGWSVNAARKLTITLGGAIMMPMLIATAFASTPLTAVLLIAVILFGFQFAIGNIQTLPSDFFAGKSVGSLAGVGGTAAVVGVLITTWMVPAITQESYVPFFLLGAMLVPLAVASVWIFGGRIEPVTSAPHAASPEAEAAG